MKGDTMKGDTIYQLPIQAIVQRENYRGDYKDEELQSLMVSMKQEGLLQPIGVRKTGPGKAEVVFGNRRFTAAKKLGWKTIPARFLDQVKTDAQRDIVNLTENIQRSNITAVDEGRAYLALVESGLTEAEVAARCSVPYERVKNAIRCFSEIPEEYRSRVVHRPPGNNRNKRGQISTKVASYIIDLKKEFGLNKDDMANLLKFAATDKQGTHQNLRRMANHMHQGVSVSVAKERLSTHKIVRVNLVMPSLTVMALEKDYKKPISDILVDYLSLHDELHVQKRERNKRLKKTTTRNTRKENGASL